MGARLKKVEQLCRRYHLKALYAFGSGSAQMIRALDDDAYQCPTIPSDLDVGVLTHASFSIESKVGFALELEKLFNVPRIDLSVLQEVDAFLAANIIRGERIYAEDPYAADEYDLFVLRRAGDLAELERERMAMIFRAR